MSQTEIKYLNRENNNIEVEKVYGNKAIEWLYQSRSGGVLSHFLCRRPLSWLYGLYQDAPLSANKVEKFIGDFDIKRQDYEKGQKANGKKDYASFNEFFIRKFRPGKRPFPNGLNELGACCEARYLVYNQIDDLVVYPVKGAYLKAKDLLADDVLAQDFENGPMLIARLCPVDYHRFHYPDGGKIEKIYTIPGMFHSVNPLALQNKNDIFITNERRVSILETENFGKMAYIEVGAICVGKIVQTHDEKTAFKRGDEKGYFLFGASTVIVLGQSGAFQFDQDLVDCSKKGLEVFIKLGDKIANKS